MARKKTKKKKVAKKRKKKTKKRATKSHGKVNRLEILLEESGDDDLSNPKELRRAVRRVLASADRSSGPDLSTDDQYELRLLIAESYWDQGHLRRAQREYLRLTESNPRNAHVMARLGLIAELFGESRIAEQHYEQALVTANKKNRTATRIAFARFLRRQGQYEEAARLLAVAARSEGKRGAAASEAAYVECLARGYDPDPLTGWRRTMQKLAADDPVFSYFLENYELWDGRPMEGIRRLRAFVARMETAAPPLANTLFYETEHARRILVRIESAQSVPMP